MSRAEEYDPKEAFEEYLKVHQGKPFAPHIKTSVEREMKLGEKGGYPTYGDESGRQEVISSYPEGQLYKTDMSEQELVTAIAELAEARKIITQALEEESLEILKGPKTTTLGNVEDAINPETGRDLSRALSILAKYEFGAETSLFDVPEAIGELVKKYTIIAERLHKKDKQ